MYDTTIFIDIYAQERDFVKFVHFSTNSFKHFEPLKRGVRGGSKIFFGQNRGFTLQRKDSDENF